MTVTQLIEILQRFEEDGYGDLKIVDFDYNFLEGVSTVDLNGKEVVMLL